ncbi:MAG: zinc ribbon domain-containing protein [Deltaproteobacteria bacterium]|nr:zinc ribbon domain-containing protein [Deltaproteobacteria bacterium]
MPIYEFQCDGCGERFEEIVLGNREDPVPCPSCSDSRTHRLMSTFSWSGSGGTGSPSACTSCSSSSSACSSCSSK